MATPTFNPATGVTTYDEDELEQDGMLSTAPSASAMTAPAPEPAPAPNYYDQGNWTYSDERNGDSAGGTGEYWIHNSGTERTNASLGTPWEADARNRQIWDGTPGGGAAKFSALANTVGTVQAIDWLQKSGVSLTQQDVDAITGSGEITAAQQHFQSKANRGPFGGMFKDVLNLAGALDVSGMTNFLTAHGSEDLGLTDYIVNPAALFAPETAEISRGLGRMSSVAAPIMSHTGQAIRYGDPFDPKGMVQGAALSAGMGAGIGLAAPHVASWINDFFGEGGLSIGEEGLSQLAEETAPADVDYDPAQDGEGMMPAAMTAEPAFDPAEYNWQTDTSPNTTFATRMAEAAGIPAPDELDAADAENRAALEAGDTPEAEPTVTAGDVQKYVKLAKTVYEMLGSNAEDASAPSRGEDETAEQYAGELADYVGLDADTMAELGLQPGSPEYSEYIMQRADEVIQSVLGDIDPDAEDLALQLRDKTQSELQQLQRALYVRGQMELLMGSGTYEDPATGVDEEVIGDGMFHPSVGAYQRGLARKVNNLSGMQGSEARGYLNRWLGGDADFFGMQGRADQRAEAEEQQMLEELKRRRRGMFGTGY